MSLKGVMDHWTRTGMFESLSLESGSTPRRPGPEVIGFIVAWDREAKQLSVEALASLANVSVSTIERIERCERVGDAALRNVAVALGREEGAFVDLRVPLGVEEALARLEDSGKWLETTAEFPVRPLRTHRQLRTLADSAAILVDGSRLRDGLDEDVDALREYLDLTGFLRAEQAGFVQGGSVVKMRTFYDEVLHTVRNIEREGYAVALCGTYQANVGPNSPMAGSVVTIGVVAFFPKLTDPCACKRPVLRGPKIVEIGFPD